MSSSPALSVERVKRKSRLDSVMDTRFDSFKSNKWLTLMCVLLAGYAMLGRGWAYVGVAPVYIAEMALFFGLAWFASYGKLRLTMPAVWLLVALASWGTLRTLPFVSAYGAAALRDAAVWGYAAFAILLFSYLADQPDRLPILLRRFRLFSIVFIWSMPVIWFAVMTLGDRIPSWPWSEARIVQPKAGDILVHYAGVLAFWVVGLGGRPLRAIHCIPIAVAIALFGAHNRGGLLSFVLVAVLCFLFYPMNRSIWRILVVGFVGLMLLLVTNVQFQVRESDSARPVSAQQMIENFLSVASDSNVGNLEDTKQWRLTWWNQIIGYTVNGPYFWKGKGFGVNLADEDGFQTPDQRLRSPHNGHLTMLARSGVPGFVLWILVHATWAWMMLAGHVSSRRRGHPIWAGVFLFLLAYWFAMMVNGSFDVFIEGPMGGVWLWTVYGVGLAASLIYRRAPDMFSAQRSNASPDPALG